MRDLEPPLEKDLPAGEVDWLMKMEQKRRVLVTERWILILLDNTMGILP